MKSSIKWTLVSGGILVLGGPLLGVLATVLSMWWCFQVLGRDGVADMSALSSGVSGALLFTAMGFALAAVGVVVTIVGLMACYRSSKPAVPPPLPT